MAMNCRPPWMIPPEKCPEPPPCPATNIEYVQEINDWDLFENYQINPFTRKGLAFVTTKITERPPNFCIKDIPGYDTLREFYIKPYSSPQERNCRPETEAQRHGWFSHAMDPDRYDERFNFSSKTSDFIKIQAMIRKYDKIMHPESSFLYRRYGQLDI